MPKPLYSQADQLAKLTVAVDPGYDLIPGNVLKLAFVLLADNVFTEVTIKTSAAWQTAVTKASGAVGLVVVTPFIDSLDIPKSTAVTEGGNDASTANGVPRLRTTSFVAGTGTISGASAAQMKELRKIAAKSGNYQHGTRVGMYLLHEGSGIGGLAAGKPIPVYNLFVSDPKKGGQGASNDYDINFHLEGGWGDDEQVFEANFVVSTLVNVPGV
jgi:hypothetical protein